jgi:molybdopterin synthase catalytic subunit
MTLAVTIRVQEADFDPGAEIAAMTEGRPSIGGITAFTGLVRDNLDEDAAADDQVLAMTLEHYPGMTEGQIAEIVAEAGRRWPLEAVTVIHRIGRLAPTDRIVFCAAASSHRGAAFDACRFVMDWLKTKAPFWKLEETPAGSRWVAAKEDDERVADAWA